MSDQLSAEEVAILIRARKIINARGIAKDADVKTICQAGGISRKTGYQWAEKFATSARQDDLAKLQEELEQFQIKHRVLEKSYDDLRFENEGRKFAWEIHGVDELLAAKKTLRSAEKTKIGKFFTGSRPGVEKKRLCAFDARRHVKQLESRI